VIVGVNDVTAMIFVTGEMKLLHTFGRYTVEVVERSKPWLTLLT